MKTYKIYSLDDRNVNEYDALEIMQGLMDGSYYYAGSVQAEDIEGAWMATQNDTHANPVLDADENVVIGSFQDMTSKEFDNDWELAGKYVADRGWTVGPAVWNGEFAQPSTKVGDVFEVDGELYRVAPCGFERMAYGKTAGILVKNLKKNRWAPEREINEDFDSLITD